MRFAGAHASPGAPGWSEFLDEIAGSIDRAVIARHGKPGSSGRWVYRNVRDRVVMANMSALMACDVHPR